CRSLPVVLTRLVERDLETLCARASGLRRRGATVVEVDAGPQPLELLFGRLALDLDVVDLLDPVAGVGGAVGEWAVVRQHERTRGVGVEPADGDDASVMA